MTTFPRRNDGEVLTAGQLNSYLDEIEQTEAELAAHATNVFNPHNTTKSQVGLGNVDNTSDLNKPVSTATQTALNGKANTSHTHVAANITDLNTAIGTHADVAASTAVRHSHSNSAVLAATTASFTTADRTKLDGIAAGADVTTSNSIDAAGGVLNSDTSTSAMQFVIDEDSMVSNLATKVPTQQSVKAYVDTAVTGIVGGEPAPHTHDDRYYTEAETTTLLSGKADTAHTHSITDTTGLQAALDAKAATTHDHHVDYIWGSSWLVGTSTRIRVPTVASGGKNYIALAAEGNTGDLGVNDTVARGDHVHDARYYTEAETNTLLSGKANTSHTNTAANITDFSTAADARITAQKGVANGLATLGADSKIPTSQIPALSLTDVYTVASQAAQLALTAQEGDVAVRTDTGLTFIHNGGTAGTMADWTQISASSDVTSVNGQTGIVVLGKTDVGLGNVDNTADVDKPISTAAQAALDAKANTSHTHVATTDLTATGTKSSSTYLRGDNTWATPPNTTYSTITQAEAENASSTTARVVTGQRLAQAVAFHAPVKVADLANYAPVSHAHTAADVTDFAETVRDTIGTALVAGSNVTITPDDVNNTITISASGGSAGPHSHVAADITDFATAVAAHTDVTANTAARHTHSNAAILNATTASFTTADETKLDGIAAGAEVNVQSDWNAVSGDAMILNKPTSMTPTAHTHTAANITDFQTQVSANTDVVANTAVRHTHSNKTTLDAITAAYTTAEQTKLAGIAAGAEVNVQSDWNAASGDAQILNKPATMPPSAHTHAAADTTTGIFDIARIPTGTTSTTVALGNHTHSGVYAPVTHAHAIADVTGLQTALDGKAASSHAHDDRYYTESEVDASLATVQGDVELYVQSRGSNLVTNGTGLLGDNTNFSSFVFDQSEVYAGKGSFKYAGKATLYNDEMLPVNPEARYLMELYAKTTVEGTGPNKTYVGIVTFDIDGQSITPYHYYRQQGTETTLTQDLNPGDTVVHLASAQNWYNGVDSHKRSIAVYGYTNGFGYTYPDYTYTRKVRTQTWAAGGVDLVNNTITLSTPWTSSWGTIPAGTAVSNCQSGGTFKYIAASSKNIGTVWTQCIGAIQGLDLEGSGDNNKFPHGTAFVKLLWLNDYDNVGATTNYSAISFSEDTFGVAAHHARTDNPHNVTKGQVGLGNVDNTADLAKPISTATQTALDGKAASVHTHTTANITDFAEGVRDTMGTALVAGANITITPDDANDTITIAASGGAHNHDDVYYTEAEVNTLLSGKANTAHTHATSDMTATGTRSSSTYLRGDNVWATPTNTTYSVATQAEIENSASTTGRLISGQRAYQAVIKHAAPIIHTHAPSDIITTNSASDNTYLSQVEGQSVWIKIPKLNPVFGGYGAVGDGTTDDTVAIQNCINDAAAANIPVYIDRVHEVTSLTLPHNLILEMTPSGSFLRVSSTAGSPVLDGSGSVGSATNLSANALLNAESVVTASNPNLVAGDYVYIIDDRDPWTSTSNRPDRDVMRVSSVTGTGPYTVNLEGTLAHDYLTANSARIAKLNYKTTYLYGVNVDYDGTAQGDGMHFNYTVESRVEGGRISKYLNYAMKFFGAYGGMVDDLKLLDSIYVTTGQGYGIGAGDGSRHIHARNVVAHGGRAVFVVTSGASYNKAINCTGEGEGVGFNTHGNESRWNEFIDCSVHNSAGNGFVSGNSTFGKDYYTRFIRCKSIGTLSNLYGAFQVTGGAESTLLLDCFADDGYNNLEAVGDYTSVIGGEFVGASSAALRFINCVGARVQGAVIRDAGQGIVASGTSTNMVVTNNQLVNVSGTKISLSGVNVEANNLY